MGEWLRDTPWRQGRILSAESAKQLGLAYPDPSQEPVVVVISHDCDLAQPIDKEPNCEAIVGRTVDKLDGNFAWAKTARRLHLPFSDGPTKIIGEFSALDKIVISKAALADHLPATNIRLNANEFTILQRWLALRYRRAAFPDAFERRLDKVHAKILKALEGTDDNVVCIFFDLDKGKEVERTDVDDPYDLSVFIVYSAEKDEKTALGAAKRIQVSLNQLFRNAYFKHGKWQEIEIRTIMPISEEAITVRQARLFKQWNTDHVSFRAGLQPTAD